MSRQEAHAQRLLKEIRWISWGIILIFFLVWLDAVSRLIFSASNQPDSAELWGPPAMMLGAGAIRYFCVVIINWSRSLDNDS
jgi:hypothetical protein